MARRYGRSPRGQRLVGTVPHGHWKTTTFFAALCLGGMIAPTVVDGAINGHLFLAWIEQQLIPTLQAGDIVVLDNLSSHKRTAVRAALERAGCRLLLLPPYGPDLNPIENAATSYGTADTARRPVPDATLRRHEKRTQSPIRDGVESYDPSN